MKTMSQLIAVALISILSACIGATITYEFLKNRPTKVLRVQAIEIQDSDGQLRGRLGTEKEGGVYLRFLTLEQKPVLSMGVQGRDSNVDNEAVSAPILQMNAKDGRRAVTMTTVKNGNGVLAFDSENRWNTLVLGYYQLDEESTLAGNRFAWGLAVKREYGETGIGVVDKVGTPVVYVSPQTSHK